MLKRVVLEKHNKSSVVIYIYDDGTMYITESSLMAIRRLLNT